MVIGNFRVYAFVHLKIGIPVSYTVTHKQSTFPAVAVIVGSIVDPRGGGVGHSCRSDR